MRTALKLSGYLDEFPVPSHRLGPGSVPPVISGATRFNGDATSTSTSTSEGGTINNSGNSTMMIAVIAGAILLALFFIFRRR